MKAFPNNRSEGMELRDYFAIKVLPTLMSITTITQNEEYIKIMCERSYVWADAMMKAREPEDDSHKVMAAAIMKKKEREEDKLLQSVLDTIDEIRGSEHERNAMFGEGYNYALNDIRTFMEARLKEKNSE